MIRDPEAARKAREETDCVREEIFRKQGVLDIGVSAIRELRDELEGTQTSLAQYAGMFKDNPLFDEWQEAIEEYRRQVENEE